MSLLDRYRKPGGFFQLVSLVETCGPAKQEKFLELIAGEDIAWADAVRTKMLDMSRIYAWSNEALSEVIGVLPDLTLATAMHAANEKVRERISALISNGRKRKVEAIFERGVPSQGEISATHVKIIETVRKMSSDGILRFEKLDPSLQIEDKIEENLSRAKLVVTHSTPNATEYKIQYEGPGEFPPVTTSLPATNDPGPDDNSSNAHDSRLQEIYVLKKRLADLSKENAVLRHELSMARSRLDQIKRIA